MGVECRLFNSYPPKPTDVTLEKLDELNISYKQFNITEEDLEKFRKDGYCILACALGTMECTHFVGKVKITHRQRRIGHEGKDERSFQSAVNVTDVCPLPKYARALRAKTHS